MESTTLLELRHIGFDWHKNRARKNREDRTSLGQNVLLEDISLGITETERVSIEGETGTGKSTLAQLLCGMQSPHFGDLYYKNNVCTYLEYKNKIHLECQLLPQIPTMGFNPKLTVEQSIYDAFIAYSRNNGVKRKDAKESFHHELMELCKQVSTDSSMLTRYPHEFSSGQLQRLALLRAFIAKPKLIVLDEPVSFLDLTLRRRILDLILEFSAGQNIAIVLISHLLEVHQYFSGTAYKLQGGILYKT